MPARQTKSISKQAATKQTTSRKRAKSAHDNCKPSRSRSTSRSVPSSWKPVAKPSKNFVINTVDSCIRLVVPSIPDAMCDEVHNVLMDVRNQIAVVLETLRVPSSKQDYGQLSVTLSKLKERKEQQQQLHSSLSQALDNQEKELLKLRAERARLKDLKKLTVEHHPLILKPQENELHLNFPTIR